jgi:hypothetical protein
MGWKAFWAEFSPLGSVQRAQAGEVRENPPRFSGCGLSLLDGLTYSNAGLLARQA